MQFPDQDLTDQFISSSYQDVIQAYLNNSNLYFLDGYGNVVTFFPTSSYGRQLLTIDQPVISASYAVTASYALNGGSTYTTTSSFNAYTSSNDNKVNSLINATSSYVKNNQTSSMSVSTASYLQNFNYNYSTSTSNIINNYVILQNITSSCRSAFFDYVINSGSNMRCGTVLGCWNNIGIEYTEYSTLDIGNTSEVIMSIGISSSYVQLLASTTNNNWNINSTGRYV